jgi:ubiquinone/menaquinone biosynthesis C-methylase UbiE
MTHTMIARFLSGPAGSARGLATRWILGPLWNRRNRALNDAAFGALHLQADDRVLEVGFGGGYLLARMACVVTAGLVAGIDVSPSLAAACRDRLREVGSSSRLDLRAAPAESLAFPDAHFNKAVSVNSVFYWQDAPKAMLEIARVLQAGGHLVLVFTDQHSMEDRPVGKVGLTLYDEGRMRSLLAAAGFQHICFTRGADRHRQFWCAEAAR